MENIDWLIHVLKVFKASTMLNEVDFLSKMSAFQWYNIPIINFLIFEGWNKLYIFFIPTNDDLVAILTKQRNYSTIKVWTGTAY
jgi:hypothetical protein